MHLENLAFTIVSPDLNSRVKLREILKTYVYKGTIKYERSLHGLAENLQNDTSTENHCDALFIASALGAPAISEFVVSANAKGISLPSIIVYITNSDLGKSSAVTSLYLQGVDGFISEPYTADALLALIETVQAKRSKLVDPAAKQKKALDFLLHDTMTHIDELARQKLRGEKPNGFILKSLREVSKTLAPIAERDLGAYAEKLADVFEKATPFADATVDKRVKVAAKRIQHPGAIVRELLETRKLSTEKILALVKIPPEEFEQIVQEKISLSDTYARELSRALGMSSREWMKMQRDYDLSKQDACKKT